MAFFLYRRGNGNEGNFPRALVEISADDCAFSVLRALVVNDYIPGSGTRRHILRELQTEGETEYGISATVYEGPKGETDFGAAWLTAELEPVENPEPGRYGGSYFEGPKPWRDLCDRAALADYREQTKGGK